MKQEQDTLISRSDACKLFGGVCTHTLRRWEIRGILKPHKINARLVLYKASDIQNVIDESRAYAVPRGQ